MHKAGASWRRASFGRKCAGVLTGNLPGVRRTLPSVGVSVGYLLGGSIVVEQVFAIPGLGRLVLGAISERNYPLLQSSILVMTAAFVLINFLVDLLYAIIDPRISRND